MAKKYEKFTISFNVEKDKEVIRFLKILGEQNELTKFIREKVKEEIDRFKKFI